MGHWCRTGPCHSLLSCSVTIVIEEAAHLDLFFLNDLFLLGLSGGSASSGSGTY